MAPSSHGNSEIPAVDLMLSSLATAARLQSSSSRNEFCCNCAHSGRLILRESLPVDDTANRLTALILFV